VQWTDRRTLCEVMVVILGYCFINSLTLQLWFSYDVPVFVNIDRHTCLISTSTHNFLNVGVLISNKKVWL